jgi:hypothetical protein
MHLRGDRAGVSAGYGIIWPKPRLRKSFAKIFKDR